MDRVVLVFGGVVAFSRWLGLWGGWPRLGCSWVLLVG